MTGIFDDRSLFVKLEAAMPRLHASEASLNLRPHVP
jgi:hypothetical protein